MPLHVASRTNRSPLSPNSALERDHPELKYCVPVFQSSRPGKNGSATVVAWRLRSERIQAGLVPIARNRVRSRTKSSFCECQFSGRKAMALGARWRFRVRVENEIGKGGNLGKILRTVRFLLASCDTVRTTRITRTACPDYLVSLEPP